MRTRVELIGKLVKPPVLGATPSGRAVLRLSVDCGEAPECLLLDVVRDEGGRDLARILNAGDHVRVVGSSGLCAGQLRRFRHASSLRLSLSR